MDDDTKDQVLGPMPVDETDIDENMNLFIYGNLIIRDVDTGEILVNQRI
jgi:hypothetical protein